MTNAHLRPSQQNCRATRPRPPAPGGTIACELGTLAPGASATVQIVVTPPRPGVVTSTAEVRSAAPDGQSANNRQRYLLRAGVPLR